jgi:hypothetical protein
MRLVGAPELLALHGADVAAAAGPVVALGDEPAGAASVDVVWRATPGDAAPGVRTIAPGGAGLWRRAPLPAADALFELPAADGEGVLVVGGAGEERDAAVPALEHAGGTARAVERPSVADLAAARVVVVVGAPGAPLPALVAPALAAARLLVAPRADPAFGFAAGVDHLAYADSEELARLAVAALRHADAFAPLAALGRIAAEAHRASVVLARLADELAAA